MDLFRPLHPVVGRHCRYCCWCRDHQQQQELAALSLRRTHFPYIVHAHNPLLRQFMFLASSLLLAISYPTPGLKDNLRHIPPLFSLPSYLMLTLRSTTVQCPQGRLMDATSHERSCPTCTTFTTCSTSWYRPMHCVPPSVGSTFWSGDDNILQTPRLLSSCIGVIEGAGVVPLPIAA